VVRLRERLAAGVEVNRGLVEAQDEQERREVHGARRGVEIPPAAVEGNHGHEVGERFRNCDLGKKRVSLESASVGA
jgi:hypothetical protein